MQAGWTACGTLSRVGLCPLTAGTPQQDMSGDNEFWRYSPSGPAMSFGACLTSAQGRYHCCYCLPEAQSGTHHERNATGTYQRRRGGHVLVPSRDSPKNKQAITK